MGKIIISSAILVFLLISCQPKEPETKDHWLTKSELKNKIKGAWAAQTIGVTYGGLTEFQYLKRIIPDSIEIEWYDTMMLHYMKYRPGLYDDVYMDLTFVEVMENEGIDAPVSSFGEAYANARYWLWHANQQGRYNILHGIAPPGSGHWINNPHADDIDFQIEADFAGIMNPGMPNSAAQVCDKIGHIMNSGDGYYGGVFVAAMYSFAFIENEVPLIINQALSLIPPESTFYQCISDVIGWHRKFPDNWKATWSELETKWGDDIGCPDGVHQDFNIDSKLNAAYVVIGLLYGEGDLGKTMEVATRCGQDSDCNPATAGAIIGTIQGYDKLPPEWSGGLEFIEDMDFSHTNLSLNKVYEISYRQALEMIERNGGEITENEVGIKFQSPVQVPFEQNFPGYLVKERRNIGLELTSESPDQFETDFEGIGVVLTGKVGHRDFRETLGLISETETENGFVLEVDISLDEGESQRVELPLYFITRNHEIFYEFELPSGNHKLSLKVQNTHPKVYLKIQDLIVYTH